MSVPSVGSVALDLVAGNTGGFFKSVQSAGNTASKSLKSTFGGAFSAIGKMAVAAISVKAVTAFTKDCINAASDLAEVQNVVDVTFKNNAETINNWAKTTQKSYGLSELAAKQYTGTMGAMLKSMKLSDKSALDMSMNIAALAGDMASFYNLDTDTAFEKIRSGISGETEPLKQLGINLSVANLEAYRMSQGITTAYSKMSQADQAILRYNYLLSVTSDAQGDFARTSGGWANQTRVLALNIETLKSSLGGLAIQALTPVIQKLNQIIEYAIAAANALTKLFGGTVKTSAAVSSGMSGLSSSAIQAADDITGTQKTAQKAAKKIKASFADIDEIHVLGNKDDTSAADAAGAAGAGAQTLIPEYSYAQSPVSPLNIEGDMEKLKKIGKITGVALMGLGVVLTLLGHPALGIAMIAAGTAITAASISDGGLTNNIQTTLSVITGIVGGAMLAVGAILCFSSVNIPVGIALLAGGALALAPAVTTNWAGMSEKTKNTIQTITSVVSGAMLAIGAILCFSSVNIPLGIALIAAGAVGLASSVTCNWNTMETQTGGVMQKIAAIAGGSLLALGVILCAAGVSLPLGLALMAAGGASLASAVNIDWDMVGKKLRGAWDSIKNWFNSHIKPVFTTEWWKNKLMAIPNAGKSVINTLLGIFEKGLNWIIGKINGLSFDVPDWVPGIGGKKFGFNISPVSIPRLYDGGYLPADNPRLAIVGDNKREGEIVTPESKIREQVELALGRVSGAINDIQQLYSVIKQAIKEALAESSFGGDWHITIVDENGGVRAEEIISAVERKNRRDGRTVIRIGG